MSVNANVEAARATGASEFWAGARACVPVLVAVLPFGLLFGALAVDNGFTVAEAVLMSATVYGGASQMVGIELFGQKIAPWLIVVSIFAVNFRHVLYSAAFGRRIGHWSGLQQALGFFLLSDPQFAETERKAEDGRRLSFAWYIGFGAPVWLAWVVETAIGGYFGGLISDPHAIGLDFLLPIYFLGLVMGFRKRPFWLPVVLASAVASMLAYKFVGSPWHVSIGAVAGILLAAVAAPVDGEKRKA
ncbi:Predicted branched-chain amino acid permease (azaleucine resistance) [Mesorhizobium albiziae]|uniref:Predicted branched-chain amino acid permease (Azaleucine resistance) n=1 Tax=Neomesorhizobium albiziae TaxID=335020 RepID=A0A1I3VFP0_9HYPH|nr:AzlC family ABC transporter permease [Mesorhizobium albiziae]GLS28827.1 branched-chain amino acid ABC transporter permease [Mesorhizobium albiziae]SFJ93186.1 Predicted branched-chain amino acid permease (azaleucine resistance) [Mesorhizobium albiziae]